MATSLKILVCGSVDGNFSKFFKKISSIQKKNGPFEMVLCCGQFFSDDPSCEQNWKKILNKKPSVDVPVYILGPTTKVQEKYFQSEKIEDGQEIYDNVLHLGRKGIFKTSSGLSIAYVSGNENKTQNTLSFTKFDIDKLKEQIMRDDQFNGVDILMTSSWPKGMDSVLRVEEAPSSQLLSELTLLLKPRYHFTCHHERYFEAPPYRNHEILQGEQRHVSRFVSMAPIVNENNQKGLYAFSITPMSICDRNELIKQPEVVIPCPYKKINKTKENASEEENQQFFFRTDDRKRKHGSNDEGKTKKTPKGPPPLSADCWFCLGSKNVEKHLVISVGEQCYVALAKGALNEDHILICPIAHHNATSVLPDDVRMEMEKYKDCVRKMFEKEKKTIVMFERNFYTQHLQLQVVGVRKSLEENIETSFEECAQEYCMELMRIPEEKDLTEMVAITTPYFYAEVGEETRFLHKVKGKMPLQFGREVLAGENVLDMTDRVDWKSCKLNREEEVSQAKAFRKRFQPYDFNFN
ncbi:CWF19-like protein 1 [Clytia hemisphaerica]|uniref:CWF19-like protein 1 n=1 Tax=Clytia hemisphaerica TaxID=252671 RepID=A0A7M5XJ70_9CNID